MSTEIKRDFYLNKLIDREKNGLIKVITGIRRCGKSYLLNTIFYNYLINKGIDEEHIIRFAFDSSDDLALIGEKLIDLEKEKRKVNPEKFMNYIKNKIVDKNVYYLLLDEVQLLECFESVLNGYLRKDNMDVYVTGSNAKFLSKDIITEFSGRGDEIQMFPLSFYEFMTFYKGDKYEGLSEYMLYGGIPMIVLKNNQLEKSSSLKKLFDEIYVTDIVKRNKIRNKAELEDLLNILSSSIGSLSNPEKIMKTFKSVKKSKITANTIIKYNNCFEDAFLISSTNRYDIRGKKYIEGLKKYYFIDVGLRNARINFRQYEKTHAMENIIYIELLRRGFDVDIGIVPITWHDKDGKTKRKQLEIDFVCNLGYKRYYIQSAFSLPNEEKIFQETRPFSLINDSFKKIIVTGDISPMYYNDEGILTVNIYDFLLNPNIIDN